MTEQQKKDKQYLCSVYKNKLSDKNPFIMYIGNGAEISIIRPSDGSFFDELDTISKYKELYKTVIDLKNKIIYALENAIEYTYSDDVQNQYNLLSSSGNDEWLAYYNIENALFRIEALWDILAHFYNIKYSLGKKINEVYHNRIFSNKPEKLKSYWNNNPPKEVKKIISYIVEDDDTERDGEWKGNYKFINSLRNNMTHKFSISQSTMSSYAFELKHHPTVILKRLCESFGTLESFINEVCKSIFEEMENKLTDGEN